MNGDALSLLRAVVAQTGDRVQAESAGSTFFAEGEDRIVWCALFFTPDELLTSWEDEQARALEAIREVSSEKAWDLYLILACELPADEREEAALDAVRRNTAYARKLLVPGTASLDPGEIRAHLAPLFDLEVPSTQSAPDAIDMLRQRLSGADDTAEALQVLERFQKNEPLFPDTSP